MKENDQTLIQLEKQENSLHAKKWTVSIFVILLCFIDQARGSAYGGLHGVAMYLSGFSIAAMILIHYHLRDFLKPAHLAWLIVCLLGYFHFTDFDEMMTDYSKGLWIVVALNIWLFGHIAITVFYDHLTRRKMPEVRWPLFGLWFLMMLGMIHSRYDSAWPFWFFSMFVCLYLTDYTKEEEECLFDGIMNGIIIAFFILQGMATCFRMYESLRYDGMFTNCNINALFYLMVECAILGKWYRFEVLGKSIALRTCACIANGVMIAYCTLTMGRTALAVMLMNSVLFLFLLLFVDKKYRLSKITTRFAGIVLAAVFSFPIVFCSVRYVPVQFASPLLHGFQNSALNTIEDFSADDDRFVSIESFIKYIITRLDQLKELDLLKDKTVSQNVPESLFPVMTANAASAEDISDLPPAMGSGTSKEDPMYSDASQINSFNIRIDIYKGYFMRLNFSGHKLSESDLWITKSHHFEHCHNLILQMLFYFGWIPGILFVCIAAAAITYFFFRCIIRRDKDRQIFFCCLIFVSSFVCFGMLEVDWNVGQLPFTLFFVCSYALFHKSKNKIVSDNS